jgi:hypothetical protein
VTHSGTGQPLAKVYVKAYAQMQDGSVRFFKDGYTDLRGRFEYTSLSTNELDFAQKFSLLILERRARRRGPRGKPAEAVDGSETDARGVAHG